MDLKQQSVLHFILLLFITVQGQQSGQPTILTQSGQNLNSRVGGIVSMGCQVENLGTYNLNWVFVKHGTTIYHGTQLMVHDTRYSLSHPPDGNMYTLQILPAQIEDQGVYKCEIEGTKQAATLTLTLEGAPRSPNITGESLNRTECCKEHSVSEACLPVCQPTSVSGSSSFVSSCQTDLPGLLYCGSDGRNHEDCCARSGVPANCLLFCSNDQEKMPTISDEELICLNYTQDIISCFEYGAALLPSPPQSLSVMSVTRNGSYTLQVSWKPPQYNPSAVSGYRVFYKKYSDARFNSTAVLNAAKDYYTLAVELNTRYVVYVVAVGHHGSSQPTDYFDIVAEDTSSPGHAKDVLLCCQQRHVSSKCQTTLCHPRIWAHFNGTEMIECYGYLADVFTCLAGESDHSECCALNNIQSECLGMCSGKPPPFSSSLWTCVPKLSIMEACIQSGLRTQPRAPQRMEVMKVGAHSALVTWTNISDAVDSYIVQLRHGNENATWYTVAEVRGLYVELTNLTETEHYAVRVISNTQSASSLPSAVVRFTTYPEITPSERPMGVHNFTKCCVDSGMPSVCYGGCHYWPNITTYYMTVAHLCLSHLGTALSCASDYRDHSACCRQRNVTESCQGLCAYTPGSADISMLSCLYQASSIIMCYEEGIVNLVRAPEEVVVTNLTSHTITVQWKNPASGPKPQKYQVDFTNIDKNIRMQANSTSLMYILQSLAPATKYSISVSSILNDTSSPPSSPTIAFTPAIDSYQPFFPSPPTNYSRALWTNRTHCCQKSNIHPECRDVCMNRPATDATNCSSDNYNILACAADGKDHSVCCRENGLPGECLPLCSGQSSANFSVHLAGCLADASLSIITSCFLSYSGLLPSMPFQFTAVVVYNNHVNLRWSPAANCDSVHDSCTYDVHYWMTDNTDLSTYTTEWNVTSPFDLMGLVQKKRYTFTVTARNSKGSGPSAPWVTLYFGNMVPDVYISMSPKVSIFDQGTTVFLSCDAFNFVGAPRFTWYLRDRELPYRGRILTLPNVTKLSEGNYTCTVQATNFSGQATRYLNVRFKPEFNYFRTDSARPNVGQEAVLACWFRGHPNISNPASVWMKNGKPLRGSSRISVSAKSRFHTGITPFKLKIANVVPSDYGMYQCHVSNKYGFATAHTKLIDPDKQLIPIIPPPLQKQNISNCCQAQGIIDTCMPLCTFEDRFQEAIENPDKYGVCLFDLDKLIKCAADGADHTLCCVNKVVPPICHPFCKGEAPSVQTIHNTPDLMQCVTESPTIMDCMQRGYDKIPTSPRNLVASFVGNKIKIAWDAPSRNADRVTSYNVHYNFTGNSVVQSETITSYVGFTHILQDVDVNHVYYIWMTAENYNFGISQISNIVSISSSDSVPMPPRRVSVTRVKGTKVIISWQPPPPSSTPAEAFAVYYKPRNAVREVKILTTENSILLSGLQAYTEYVVYVRSRNYAGEGLKSALADFKTGQTDSSSGPQGKQGGGSSLGGGQIAGIVLAVVVVIVVVILMVVLLFRSRIVTKKEPQSVSFENPSYGNQQVHIGGLPSSNVCDNVMQQQTRPERDGNFDYSRLQEDGVCPESPKHVSETDFPNTEYATPADPNGVNVDVSNNGMATLGVPGAGVKPDESSS